MNGDKLGDTLKDAIDEFRVKEFDTPNGTTTIQFLESEKEAGWRKLFIVLSSMALDDLLSWDETEHVKTIVDVIINDADSPSVFEDFLERLFLNFEVAVSNRVSSLERLYELLNEYSVNRIALNCPEIILKGSFLRGQCFYVGVDTDSGTTYVYKIDLNGNNEECKSIVQGNKLIGCSRERSYLYIGNDDRIFAYDLICGKLTDYEGKLLTVVNHELFIENDGVVYKLDGNTYTQFHVNAEYEIAVGPYGAFDGLVIKPLIRGLFAPYSISNDGRIIECDDISYQVWMDIILSMISAMGFSIYDVYDAGEDTLTLGYSISLCSAHEILSWFAQNKNSQPEIYKTATGFRKVICVLGNILGYDTDLTRLLMNMRRYNLILNSDYYREFKNKLSVEELEKIRSKPIEDMTSVRMISDAFIDYDHVQYFSSDYMKWVLQLTKSELAYYVGVWENEDKQGEGLQ